LYECADRATRKELKLSLMVAILAARKANNVMVTPMGGWRIQCLVNGL
jgi:hypothetical protein